MTRQKRIVIELCDSLAESTRTATPYQTRRQRRALLWKLFTSSRIPRCRDW